ncbi:MAG: hypothetical protein HQL90_15080 [Magnetococcales bacterium]|nr:hypothetical protein [Magnetococcales bacterium]
MIRRIRTRRCWVAYLAGFAGGVTAYYKLVPFGDAHYYTVAGILASVSGTVLGFIIAAMAILASVEKTLLIKNLRRVGYYTQLIWEFFNAAVFFFSALILSIVCLFLIPPSLAWALSGVFWAIVTASGFLLVAGYHFYLVVSNLDTE